MQIAEMTSMLVLSDSVRERVPATFEQNGANCFPLIIRAWCSEMTGWLAGCLADFCRAENRLLETGISFVPNMYCAHENDAD